MKKGAALILGAGSDIGMATARSLAAKGYDIQLAARDVAALEDARTDLDLRHTVSVSLHAFDVLETERFDAFIDALPELPEIVVCAIGLMGDQVENEQDAGRGALVLRTNFEGPALILERLAQRFDARGSGQIVGISSVAGLRGRATNYVYGAAKAGFSAYLSGLRNRLTGRNVHVMTVLPGFVDTAMTAGLDLPPALTAAPEEVGEAIVRGLDRGRNVIYVRRIWQVIMFIITRIPEPIFKKLRL